MSRVGRSTTPATGRVGTDDRTRISADDDVPACGARTRHSRWGRPHTDTREIAMGHVPEDPPGPGDAWPRGTGYPLSGSEGNQYGAIPARGTAGTRVTPGFVGQHLSKIIVAV